MSILKILKWPLIILYIILSIILGLYLYNSLSDWISQLPELDPIDSISNQKLFRIIFEGREIL